MVGIHGCVCVCLCLSPNPTQTHQVVQMSQIWSCLRGDVVPEVLATEKQDFVRTTTKYRGT